MQSRSSQNRFFSVSQNPLQEFIKKRADLLEEVEGDTALAWVAAQNNRTMEKFAANSFAAMEQSVLAIEEDKNKIPFTQINNGFLYNLCRDADHVQGIFRRTTLDEYRKEHPQWEILLDLDNLPEKKAWQTLIDEGRHKNIENEKWYLNYARFSPNGERVLIGLSLGGTDAAAAREFDLTSKKFVENGFEIQEQNIASDWYNNDVLLCCKMRCDLSNEDYIRTLRYWPRGEAPQLIWADSVAELPIFLKTQVKRDRNYHWLQCEFPTTNKFYLLSNNLQLQEMFLPNDANIEGFFKDYIIVTIDRDWQLYNDRYPAGSIFAIEIKALLKNKKINATALFVPQTPCFAGPVCVLNDNIFITVLNNVKEEIYRYRLLNNNWQTVKMPFEGWGSVGIRTAERQEDNCFIVYQDFLTPKTLYYYHDKNNTLEKLKLSPAYFAADNFTVKQFFAESADGTSIPYFIIQHKNTIYDGHNPTILTGYGGFEESLTPMYLAAMGKLWLESGGVYVMANLRGGKEFGPNWHSVTVRENRIKVYEDFIAVAEDLITKKITQPHCLGISGGSNGGLLVATVALMRPELFNAVLCSAPLLDMLEYTRLGGQQWISEYGNPDDPYMRSVLASYSPYHNVATKIKYPEILFLACMRDDRVHPAHARKMVDKMQLLGHEVFYFENKEGGHDERANHKRIAFEEALEFNFFKQKLMSDNLTLRKTPTFSR